MNPTRPHAAPPPALVPPAVLAELRAYLRESGSTLSPAEAILDAIKLWIAKGRADAVPARGYQWKQLFLPDTTQVRVSAEERRHYADVAGDELI